MHVLVVDDTPEIAQLLHMNLEHQGLTVSMVTSEFERLLGPGLWHGVDVAIVDLMLPRTSGHSILSYLREHHPHIRRVVLSASIARIKESKSMAHFAFEKPIDFDELRKAVVDG